MCFSSFRPNVRSPTIYNQLLSEDLTYTAYHIDSQPVTQHMICVHCGSTVSLLINRLGKSEYALQACVGGASILSRVLEHPLIVYMASLHVAASAIHTSRTTPSPSSSTSCSLKRLYTATCSITLPPPLLLLEHGDTPSNSVSW